MKIVFLLLVISTFLFSATRPTIALVLSGGGARGGAHVGILKILEEKNIPIDMIVGTSMGSYVGGLYASGKTPQEIEKLLVTSDWRKYITTNFVREDIPMRKKEIQYQYQGKLGLGVDKNNNIVLPTGVFKREPMLMKFLSDFEHVETIKDFNKLSIPFRAVSTNILNGKKVVIDSGSLGEAVYASSAIPGLFQPIKIDGIDLVDGGVSDNMPIGVAKEMGADIIIAVDVSENFDKNLDVNSYFVVMGQLANILMRKNANDSIATLSDKDVLLTPDLTGFSGLDADKYAQIIQKGVEIAQKEYEKKLKHLSINDDLYAKYKANHKLKVSDVKPIIDKIVIDNQTYLSDEVILGRLSIKEGDRLDTAELRENILHIYNTGEFDRIEYELEDINGTNILKVSTKPSWDTNGEIRLSLGLEDDFDGHSTYSLKLGYTMFGLNEYGGEWKNDLEIGRRKAISSELFQPLSSMQRYYINPSVLYEDTNEMVPASTLGVGTKGKYEVDIQRYGASLGLGTHIFTNYEIEIGASMYRDTINIDLLNIEENYKAMPIYASIRMDDLDNVYFPNSGTFAEIVWTKELENLGSDYNYEQIYLEFEKPLTIDRHNITTYLKYGQTYKQKGQVSLAGSFTLGGLFNLSGLEPYSSNNENMFLGVMKYRYELKDGGFFASLNSPLYAGFSLEVGNTWGKNETVSYDMMTKSGTLYLAADTFLGPFYLAYGVTDSGEQSVYLYLGEKF